MGCLQGQASLAYPAGAGDRHQAAIWVAQLCDRLRALGVAADKRRQRGREIMGGSRRRIIYARGAISARLLVHLQLLNRTFGNRSRVRWSMLSLAHSARRV